MSPMFQCPLDKKKTENLFRIAILLANLFFLVSLVVLGFRGTLSRYWADDYCFGAIYQRDGLLSGTQSFYSNVSNRFGAFLMVGLNEIFGETAIRIYPAFMILFFLASFTLVIDQLFKVIEFPQKWYVVLLLGQAFTYFLLFMAPNLFQSLFWRSGMVSYFAPLPFFGFAIYFWLLIYRKGLKWYFAVLIPLITFFAAGMSETFAAMCAGFWAILIFLSLLSKRKEKKALVLGSVFALLGTLAAMFIMIKAPGNAMRLETLDQTTNLVKLATQSMRFAADFGFQSLRGLPVPTIALLGLVSILGYHLSAHQDSSLVEKDWLKITLLTLLIGYVLLVCVAAPTVFGMSAYPEERAWMIGRFVTVAVTLLSGFSLGVLSHRFMDRIVDTCLMSILILIVLSLYPLRGTWTEIRNMEKWLGIAQAWDERQTLIQDKIDDGEMNLVIPALDSIGSVAELKEDTSYWVNVCAAEYYEVEQITAVEDYDGR